MKNSQNYWAFHAIKKKKQFFLCMYKIDDISAEICNKAEVSVIKTHENDDINKTVLLLLCISDAKKKMRW